MTFNALSLAVKTSDSFHDKIFSRPWLDIEGNALFEEVQVVYQALGLHLIIVEGAAHQVAPPAGVSL